MLISRAFGSSEPRPSGIGPRAAGAAAIHAVVCAAVVTALYATALGAGSQPKPEPEDNPKVEAPAGNDQTKETKEKTEEKKKEKPNDRYFVLQGGTVHTVTNGTLYGVSIVAKNGRIIAISAGPGSCEEPLAHEQECEVLDASGYHVYPGLVAVSSGGVLGGEPPDDTTDVYSLELTIALAGGITTAVVGNTAGKLTFGSTDGLLVKRDLFKRLNYSASNPAGRAKLRTDLEKVRQYIRDLEAYQEKKKIEPEAKEPDKEWLKGDYEAYLQLLRGEGTAILTADEAQEIIDVCSLARRFGFRAVVEGATEGWTVAPQMARAGVSAIIGPRDRAERDERLNRPTGSSIENAAILHRHGVVLAVRPPVPAVTLWGLAGRDLLQLNMDAAFAVRGGLDADAALRTITIDAARILGIDHRVGSIEVGKDADFAITDGDVLHYMTHTRWTVVNGRVAYDKQKDTLYDHIRPGGDEDAPPPDDYWPRRLGMSQ